MFEKAICCRICGNTNLRPILDLGDQALTGRFPHSQTEHVEKMPLQLVLCQGHENEQVCGLVQLMHTGDLNKLYGAEYGYRSGLNTSMVRHLENKVQKILTYVDLKKEDLVIDIGSNDGTLLKSYPTKSATLVGIDPSGKNFQSFYPSHVQLIPEFFSANTIRQNFPNQKAMIVTSISMFYDLEQPLKFAEQISETLDDKGIWITEQSYLPSMLEMNSYDTICHEHLEYYGLKQIKWIADGAGLKIIDVEFNKINGGSFSVALAKSNSEIKSNEGIINAILNQESVQGLSSLTPYEQFKRRVFAHREQLLSFFEQLRNENKKIFGYGASTKGNVLLQFCNLSEKDLPFIAEVNQDKFGCFTPGTLIPIVSEVEAKRMNPDYFFVLPWHFRENIISREKEYLRSGGRLVFPLPSLEVV